MTIRKVIAGAEILYVTPIDDSLKMGNFFLVTKNGKCTKYPEGHADWITLFNAFFFDELEEQRDAEARLDEWRNAELGNVFTPLSERVENKLPKLDVETKHPAELVRRTREGSMHLMTQEERNYMISVRQLHPTGTPQDPDVVHGALPSPVISPFVVASDELDDIYTPLSTRKKDFHSAHDAEE